MNNEMLRYNLYWANQMTQLELNPIFSKPYLCPATRVHSVIPGTSAMRAELKPHDWTPVCRK